jgi:citrate lyase subunit beta/citryl-CoA lyase
VLGTNDIVRETAVKSGGDRVPVVPWLSMAVLAARAEKLFVLDGVYNDFQNAKGFEAECAQGRALGMDGKTIIHPNQVAAANRTFTPSEAEVSEAREIMAAFAKPENKDKGVIALNGRMVERLHAKIAERTLKLVDIIAARA